MKYKIVKKSNVLTVLNTMSLGAHQLPLRKGDIVDVDGERRILGKCIGIGCDGIMFEDGGVANQK